jgi:hypothetical protein
MSGIRTYNTSGDRILSLKKGRMHKGSDRMYVHSVFEMNNWWDISIEEGHI